MSAAIEERLSRAVWDVVASRGIEAATMRAVADSAECTTGLITHYFPSRAALLEHARRTMFTQTTIRADAAELSASDPAQRLRAVLMTALPLDEARREEARVWLGFAAASIADPTLRAVHEDGNRMWLSRITRLVEVATDAPNRNAATSAAVKLIALVEGLGSLAVLDPATYTDERIREALDSALDSAHTRPIPN